jgi:hypothetical protein
VSGAENKQSSERNDFGSRGGRSPPALFVAQVEPVRSYLWPDPTKEREVSLNTEEKKGSR